ncbi:MAG TPA: hypothetical protein VIK78_14015 [Ruminiclostridium sp.]
MNNLKNRKYSRATKKGISRSAESDETEFSLSATAALCILGGTFLVGLISGKLLCMCRES